MSSSQPSRRQFLQGGSFLGKLRDVAQSADVSENETVQENLPPSQQVLQSNLPSVGGFPMLRFSRNAMASDFEITFNRGQYPQATAAALDALDEIERYETLLSAFKKESEISSLNRNAAREPVPVMFDEVWRLLWQCREFSRETHGAIDVTASPLWRLWGFAKREGKVPLQLEIDAALQNVGHSLLQLDPKEKTIHFLREGMEINLGCIGKGAALDSAAQKISEQGVEHVLLHGGRSSVLARGGRMAETWTCDANEMRFSASNTNFVLSELSDATFAAPSRDRSVGWTIGVPHPLRPGRRFAEIRLTNESLGTSGSQHQFFICQGKRYGHIIDPRTGYPATGALTTIVIAPTAAIADALSTAFFVLRPEEIAEYCRKRSDVAALLIAADEIQPQRYKISHFGFEANQIRFL
ncbi:MAG: FAD:protein FMN transferase [Planctomycetaceae bacterium]|jgi:thiamine biosynthesis lipoprotein|nr:FAD:protein FMN transferase [Planctomycetaceae bacterium]